MSQQQIIDELITAARAVEHASEGGDLSAAIRRLSKLADQAKSSGARPARRNGRGEYGVMWEIGVDAKSRLDAAEQAQEIMRDPQSTATVFLVKDGPLSYTIDLREVEAEAAEAAEG